MIRPQVEKQPGYLGTEDTERSVGGSPGSPCVRSHTHSIPRSQETCLLASGQRAALAV